MAAIPPKKHCLPAVDLICRMALTVRLAAVDSSKLMTIMVEPLSL